MPPPLAERALTIVIVSFNVREDLDRCLRSIPAAVGDLSTTIVVVDNGSRDGTGAMLRERWPEVALIELGSNLGFASANNVGIRATRGELVLLLNPDTVTPAGSLARLVRVLREHPEAAAAGPRLVDAAGQPELSFGWPMSPLGELRQKLIEGLARRGVGRVRRALARSLRTAGTRDWISGACLLARRADLEAVGLLDERFFMYAEDIDFCAAIRAHGRKVLFVPDVEIVHLRGRSRQTVPAATQTAYRRSHIAFYEKHHPAWAPWLRRYLRWRGQLPEGSG